MDPVTQQLAFDFETTAGRQLQVVPAASDARLAHRSATLQAAAVQEMFLRAVRLEENAASVPSAVDIYQEILVVRPGHAPTLINLGTIHYNRREYEQAEVMYRRATAADPEYALAFFDLGNVLDEMQRLSEATVAYQRAVTLVPQYADAHYNLALAYERQGQRRRALRHWLTYVRLDPVGPWASHAQLQARKILSTEKLSIVSRRGRRVAMAV
jgi:tetratricopeptide (TPR) repeat protein